MIIPDINLLIYAYDTDSRYHAKAASWWQACLSGTEQVGLSPVVLFGFVRIGTSPRVFRHPMGVAEAAGHVRSWLKQPVAQLLDTGHDHVEDVLKLLENLGTAGNLVTDGQLAALAIDYNATIHTSDADFIRFKGLKWFNPIHSTGRRR